MPNRAGMTLVTIAAVMAFPTAPRAAPALARSRARAIVYRVHQQVALAPGQDATYTVACRDGDLAVYGTWRTDAVVAVAGGVPPPDLASAVEVAAADPFDAGGYRFSLRNLAEGTSRVSLGVVCLKGTLTGGGHARFALHESPLHTRTSAIAAAGALSTPVLRCPPGSVAVSPGFAATGGQVRLVSRFAPRGDPRALDRAFVALGAATVRTSIRCQALRTAAGGPRLRMILRRRRATIAPGRSTSASISCARDERAIMGSLRLRDAWSLGASLGDRTQDFRVQGADAVRDGHAEIGVLCLALRA